MLSPCAYQLRRMPSFLGIGGLVGVLLVLAIAAGGCGPVARAPVGAADRLDVEEDARPAAGVDLRRQRKLTKMLLEAQDGACELVPAEGHTANLFSPQNVVSVLPLEGPDKRPLGALITLRAEVRGSRQKIQSLVNCYLARSVVLSQLVPETTSSSVDVQSVWARIVPAKTGFAVQLQSSDPATAREIFARAKRMARANPRR